MQRRNFLQLCSAAGLGFASPLCRDTLAQTAAAKQQLPSYDGPYYVVFNASGGWDTTYMMDPKGIGGINRLYKDSDILSEGNLQFAPTKKHIEKGMSNEAFFAKYAKELLVLNGIDYSVNNHAPCSRYMATGELDNASFPTFAALIAGCKGSDVPLAFLTFGNFSGTGNIVPMSRVPYLPSLSKLANADGVQGNSKSPFHDDFVTDRIERALAEQLQTRIKAKRLPRVERSQSMLFAAQVNSKALKRVTPFIPKKAAEGRLPRQADIALASFKAGVCVSANLSIGQFDSHANNDRDQMKLIPEFLSGIDYLMTKAEELKIREKLVVVIQSEMGRTPNYNKGQGKDHWSVGSIMFVGKGIKGNRVIGKTDEKQFLTPVNASTLALDRDNGIRIRPEHIHEALRSHAGIANHQFSERFPLKVQPEERLTKLFA